MKRSVYICRKVVNSDDIKAWAQRQGFASCLPKGEMHVTVAFDHRKHDWRDLPLDAERTVDVIDPDERSVELFRNGAVVLEIFSTPLTIRWAELVQAGLHWKYPDYRPHITLTYNMPEGFDLSKIQPFDGKIELGPEITSSVIWNQRNHQDEDPL